METNAVQVIVYDIADNPLAQEVLVELEAAVVDIIKKNSNTLAYTVVTE